MIIKAPCTGKVVQLKKVPDPVFQKKMLGDGVAIIPTDGNFVTPMDGEFVTVFPTKHAYGIKNGDFEVLIHIGINTVSLDGKGFTSLVKQGSDAKAGEKMAKVDLDFIKGTNTPLETPILITSGHKFKLLSGTSVKAGEDLLEIEA